MNIVIPIIRASIFLMKFQSKLSRVFLSSESKAEFLYFPLSIRMAKCFFGPANFKLDFGIKEASKTKNIFEYQADLISINSPQQSTLYQFAMQDQRLLRWAIRLWAEEQKTRSFIQTLNFPSTIYPTWTRSNLAIKKFSQFSSLENKNIKATLKTQEILCGMTI